MAKDKLDGYIQNEEILWSDRKRILGMPITFTKYSFDNNRFYCKTGLLNTREEEILLYRILDITSSSSFFQKIFKVGNVILNTADQTTPEFVIKSVKNPERIRKALSNIVERERDEKRVLGKEMYGVATSIDNIDGDIMN